MPCRVCKSPLLVRAWCKHSGLLRVYYGDETYEENAPIKFNLGASSDYFDFTYCGSCGAMQNGTWPIPTEKAKCAECGSYNLSEEPVLHCVACGCFVNESNQVE